MKEVLSGNQHRDARSQGRGLTTPLARHRSRAKKTTGQIGAVHHPFRNFRASLGWNVFSGSKKNRNGNESGI